MTDIDHKTLLKKYMKIVRFHEGATFVPLDVDSVEPEDGDPIQGPCISLTQAELTCLQALEDEVIAEG